MTPHADELTTLGSAVAEPLALAALGTILLWIVIRLRRLSESWRGAQKLDTRPDTPARPTPAEVARRRAAAAASLIIGTLFLLGASAYLSLSLIPEAFQYFELRKNLTRGQQTVRSAIWADPRLGCPNNEPLGIQLQRLFVQPRIYLLNIRWDAVPPRYEVAVLGRTPLVVGSAERDVELHISVGVDGTAELHSATVLEEPNAIEAARRLLASACTRGLPRAADPLLLRRPQKNPSEKPVSKP